MGSAWTKHLLYVVLTLTALSGQCTWDLPSSTIKTQLFREADQMPARWKLLLNAPCVSLGDLQ